jgi:hypothetical protein
MYYAAVSARTPGAMLRRELLTIAGLGLVTACARRVPRSGAADDGVWLPYERPIVIDGLGSPIQFNIPQESLPLVGASRDP